MTQTSHSEMTDLRVGVDIGSSTIKLVACDAERVVDWEVVDATARPSPVAVSLLSRYPGVKTMATGYGRHLLEMQEVASVTEIKACAAGVAWLYDDVRAVIDIGGQDVKVIALDSRGRVGKFEMNDRCAAGTGKFLEMTAATLDCTLEEFSRAASVGKDTITISSHCAVFAESEIVGLLNDNRRCEDIARAVHRGVAKRIAGMYKRVIKDRARVCLVGGGARNGSLCRILEQELGAEVLIPKNPQIVVALGASLLARKRAPHQE